MVRDERGLVEQDANWFSSNSLDRASARAGMKLFPTLGDCSLFRCLEALSSDPAQSVGAYSCISCLDTGDGVREGIREALPELCPCGLLNGAQPEKLAHWEPPSAAACRGNTCPWRSSSRPVAVPRYTRSCDSSVSEARPNLKHVWSCCSSL